VYDAHQVDIDDPAPIVDRDAVNAAAGRDAGIVAEHVDLAEGRKRFLRGALDAVGIGNIASNAVRTVWREAFDRSHERVLLDIGQHQLHAGLCKGFGHRQPDTGRPAGDERRLVAKLLHRSPSLFVKSFSHVGTTLRLHRRSRMVAKGG
jgi:hypothetical protein